MVNLLPAQVANSQCRVWFILPAYGATCSHEKIFVPVTFYNINKDLKIEEKT